ncbi:MAG: ribonucleotide-diphosphate reductase subunit beta [Candidatus Margulisbacteria bacterium]|nr:ribonucleotide-diphosphate reductase subunit beta [Candidatus Margulisiibacteriota bacterium]
MSAPNLFQEEFKPSKLTNADIINQRRVINGFDDGLMQISPLKHPWAYDHFNNMIKNTWVPQEVPMQSDINMWCDTSSLTDQERRVYSRSLAFVSNLDGLQTNNLACNIIRHITSPEVVLAIARQTFEEALHVQSYATLVEAMQLDPEEIYGLYRRDQELYEKNQIVLRAVNKIADPLFKTGTFENDQMFLEACIGNIVLEGIYFFSAFLIFYNLRRNNKMQGSGEMIQFINRDEDMHLRLFTDITNAIKEEQPELWTDAFKARITQNIKDAVEMEATWGESCIGTGILGLTPDLLKEYIQFVGDVRLQSIGLPKIWNSKNPFAWIDEYTQGSMIEVNFFEGTVREYQTGTLEW